MAKGWNPTKPAEVGEKKGLKEKKVTVEIADPNRNYTKPGERGWNRPAPRQETVLVLEDGKPEKKAAKSDK